MRQDQNFPAHLKSEKCDTFESLWGEFFEKSSKIGPQIAVVRIVHEHKSPRKTLRAAPKIKKKLIVCYCQAPGLELLEPRWNQLFSPSQMKSRPLFQGGQPCASRGGLKAIFHIYSIIS